MLDDPPVPCPLCHYDLRAQVEPRCPECGHAFDWTELRARGDRHPYVFEHADDHRVRSFLLTLLAGLRPVRFWRQLRPTHVIARRRLLIYFVLVAALAILLGSTESAVLVQRRGDYQPWLVYVDNALWQNFVSTATHFVAWPAVVTMLIWPWATLAMFAIFGVSLRRSRIRFDQLLRVVIYSSDTIVWAVVFMVPLNALFNFDRSTTLATLCLTLALLAMSIRLILAAGLYLRFHQSIRMALLAQLVVLFPLVGFWIILFMSRSIFGYWP